MTSELVRIFRAHVNRPQHPPHKAVEVSFRQRTTGSHLREDRLRHLRQMLYVVPRHVLFSFSAQAPALANMVSLRTLAQPVVINHCVLSFRVVVRVALVSAAI